MTVDAKRKFLINAAFVALIVVILYFIFRYLLIWLLPFVIGFACAIVLQRPVRFLTKKTKLPRALWSVVLVIVILTVFFLLLVFLGRQLYAQSAGLVSFLRNSLPGLREAFNSISDRFAGWMDRLPQSVAAALRSSPTQVFESAIGSVSTFLTDFARTVVMNVPGLLLTTLISIVACCFITNDYYKITNFILCQLPVRAQKVLLKSKRVFMENILKMLRGYLIIMGITFVELLIGFLIMGVDYAVTVALLIAILDVMPVLGVGTALIPWGIVELIMNKTGLGIGLLVLYVIIAALRNVWEPKIIGDQVGLPPIVTLIAMYLGLTLFGFVGLWGVPILTIIAAKLQESGMVRIWKDASPLSASVAEERKGKEKEKEKS